MIGRSDVLGIGLSLASPSGLTVECCTVAHSLSCVRIKRERCDSVDALRNAYDALLWLVVEIQLRNLV